MFNSSVEGFSRATRISHVRVTRLADSSEGEEGGEEDAEWISTSASSATLARATGLHRLAIVCPTGKQKLPRSNHHSQDTSWKSHLKKKIWLEATERILSSVSGTLPTYMQGQSVCVGPQHQDTNLPTGPWNAKNMKEKTDCRRLGSVCVGNPRGQDYFEFIPQVF